MYAREDEGGTIKSFHYLNWVLRVGTCNQFFFFGPPASPHLASPRFTGLRVSSRPHEISPKWIYERGLSFTLTAETSLRETSLFSARNAGRRIHFCAFRRAAPFLSSIKTLASFGGVFRLVTRVRILTQSFSASYRNAARKFLPHVDWRLYICNFLSLLVHFIMHIKIINLK